MFFYLDSFVSRVLDPIDESPCKGFVSCRVHQKVPVGHHDECHLRITLPDWPNRLKTSYDNFLSWRFKSSRHKGEHSGHSRFKCSRQVISWFPVPKTVQPRDNGL